MNCSDSARPQKTVLLEETVAGIGDRPLRQLKQHSAEKPEIDQAYAHWLMFRRDSEIPFEMSPVT